MDVNKVLEDLRQERTHIDEVIASLERLVFTRQNRRGRPPGAHNGIRKRGRPRGSKNRPKLDPARNGRVMAVGQLNLPEEVLN